jgi:hypothetical protein
MLRACNEVRNRVVLVVLIGFARAQSKFFNQFKAVLKKIKTANGSRVSRSRFQGFARLTMSTARKKNQSVWSVGIVEIRASGKCVSRRKKIFPIARWRQQKTAQTSLTRYDFWPVLL